MKYLSLVSQTTQASSTSTVLAVEFSSNSAVCTPMMEFPIEEIENSERLVVKLVRSHVCNTLEDRSRISGLKRKQAIPLCNLER